MYEHGSPSSDTLLLRFAKGLSKALTRALRFASASTSAALSSSAQNGRLLHQLRFFSLLPSAGLLSAGCASTYNG